MNMPNNSLPDPEKIFKDMQLSGELDEGIIIDGLCSTPKDQQKFDAEEKGKKPITV